MLVLRIVVFLLLLLIGAALATAFVTRNRRWLNFAAQITRWGVIFVLVFLAFYLFERLVMVV
jgi:hypothetical protein